MRWNAAVVSREQTQPPPHTPPLPPSRPLPTGAVRAVHRASDGVRAVHAASDGVLRAAHAAGALDHAAGPVLGSSTPRIKIPLVHTHPGDSIRANGTSQGWTPLRMLPGSSSVPQKLTQYVSSTRLQGGPTPETMACILATALIVGTHTAASPPNVRPSIFLGASRVAACRFVFWKWRGSLVQGYLAHKKLQPPRTL